MCTGAEPAAAGSACGAGAAVGDVAATDAIGSGIGDMAVGGIAGGTGSAAVGSAGYGIAGYGAGSAYGDLAIEEAGAGIAGAGVAGSGVGLTGMGAGLGAGMAGGMGGAAIGDAGFGIADASGLSDLAFPATGAAGIAPAAAPASSGLFSSNNMMLASTGMQLYEQDQMRKLAARADPMGSQRKLYAQQLRELEANPSSITSRPGYQFGLNQGTQALQRSMAAQGYTGSGNAQLAMDNYAQDYAMRFLNQEQSRLAYLAGAGIGPEAGINAMNSANNMMGGAANNLTMYTRTRNQPGMS